MPAWFTLLEGAATTILLAGGVWFIALAMQPLRAGEDRDAPVLCFLAAMVAIFCGLMTGASLIFS